MQLILPHYAIKNLFASVFITEQSTFNVPVTDYDWKTIWTSCGLLPWLLASQAVDCHDIDWIKYPGLAFEFNSSPPIAAYMRPWTESTLVQIMACRLVGAKPLSEPMLEFC